MSADRPRREPSVRELLEAARAEGRFSAAAWSVGSSDGVRCHGALGTSAADDHHPIGEDTLFDLASVTKPVVGLALLRLVDSVELT